MKRRNIFRAAVVSLIITVSCDKTDFTPNVADNAPSVQAFLYAGRDSLKVTIAKLLPYSNNEVDTVQAPITNLKVYVNDTLLQETSGGIYFRKTPAAIQYAATYNLRFEYNEQTITATTQIPTKTSGVKISDTLVQLTHVTKDLTGVDHRTMGRMNPITVSWNNANKDYHFVVVEFLGDTTNNYVNDLMAESGGAEITYISRPNQDNAYTIEQRQLAFYGNYRLVLCRINKEYYDLFQTSSSTSNSISNAPSNITNGWGIFTGISSDTLYLRTYE